MPYLKPTDPKPTDAKQDITGKLSVGELSELVSIAEARKSMSIVLNCLDNREAAIFAEARGRSGD